MNSPLVYAPTTGTEQEQSKVQVEINMAGMIGRIKAPPVCVDATLKQEAMSVEELSKLSFPLETPKGSLCHNFHVNEPSVVSSSSSIASRESLLSDHLDGGSSRNLTTTPLRRQSEIILKVTNQKASRNGRQTQRYSTDPNSQRVCRMVTGCVPIVEGGKILFVSSSRKSEWILPKGGWERDEAMEESAIRECFEEAGVLGVLGPLLSEVEYETRKAKKRRKEFEELQKKVKVLRAALSDSPTRFAVTEESERAQADEKVEDNLAPGAGAQDTTTPPQVVVSNETISRIRGQQSKQSDETCSVASDSSAATHSHVRMSLFPLYVSEVKKEWPESGRLRKAVDIDEAIQICESRPELRTVLVELKERNLHLLPSQGPNKIKDR